MEWIIDSRIASHTQIQNFVDLRPLKHNFWSLSDQNGCWSSECTRHGSIPPTRKNALIGEKQMDNQLPNYKLHSNTQFC